MMQLLLDTHTLLWWLADMPQLGPTARRAIAAAENQVLVSAASAWEIEIKRALGKLDAPEDLQSAIADAGFETLPMTVSHCIAAARLPPHHLDPFDRVLIGQAMEEQLTIVTQDQAFARYTAALLAAGK
jgi:PIN domain nuclease of toxin-antitoxin system